MTIFELPHPISAYRAFRSLSQQPYPAILDSSPSDGQNPPPLGQRSFVAADPFLTVHGKQGTAELRWPRSGRQETWHGNLFHLLSELLEQHKTGDRGPCPLACGGAIGYLAYDLFTQVETLTRSAQDDIGMPDLFLAFYDTVAIFDHCTDRAVLAMNDWGYGTVQQQKDRWVSWLQGPPPPLGDAPILDANSLTSNFTYDNYCRAIQATREYIAAGDIYQANISQRFSAPYRGDPIALYGRLRETSSAPFAACLFPDHFAVLSNSPERYLLIDGAYIETRPIKGTRPRGRTQQEDMAYIDDLRHSIKDRAEHLMIVDLERNDLGRVCEYNSVHVPAFEVIESYANVHHMVSTVAGRVHPARDTTECIRNSFPGGSITGAPKIRAIEVIDELEPTARGVYCGSIGYIDFSGRVDLNIAIRTAVLSKDRLYFQVGGGIVTDSDPQEEYQETLTKAQAFLKVLTGEGRVWNERVSA